MDKNRVNDRDGKARRTNAVEEVQRFHLSSDYDLELCPGSEISDTGRLDIGKVLPHDASLPWFGIRWDERATAIDVDVYQCTLKEESDFKKGKAGYHGHRTTAIDQPGRVVDLHLIWKGQPVYHGCIKCSIGRDVEVLLPTIKIQANATAVLWRTCRSCGNRFMVLENESLCPVCRS
jgi:hypothetical protein